MSAPELALHGVEEGRGSPLLVLHGFTGSSESMAGVAAGLSGRHRVLRLDLLGHGESAAPREPAAYSMERCVAQISAALDARAIERAHVIGYSMGGRAALALAAWRPERVRSALLVGASAGLADPKAREARVRDDEALAQRIESEGLERFVDAWMALPLFESQRRLGAEALAAARAQRLRNRPHGLANSLRGMGSGAQPPLHPLLAQLLTPVALVHGEQDTKFAEIAHGLAAALPRGRAVAVANAGHACHLEAPHAFLELADAWLAECDAAVRVRASA
ncbi:MAG: 2-succinyl-6-hydroxy-2,4-cyclohexadiene-1-carboxylate synthase [Deltaproteobacteria bacterium]|nr:2-succinyl-6-hydroxy-2,4-cyclohexadiene-1-carboxylate synthase [Deltaproteobacteria bacterium]MBW2361570.1 2-succinyl-6-hydroxy-2,4-cyclohexadiene-1-carboxylate synthase [Deltaproteobacteria bacterium]